MFGSWGPTNTVLLRATYAASIDVVPGQLRFFENKGTDFSTNSGSGANGIVNTENVLTTGYWAIRAFNNDAAALVKGKCYELQCGGTDGKDPQVKKFVNGTTSVYRIAVIATAATADQTWDWFAIQGVVPFALVDGNTDVALGDCLKIKTNDANGGVSVMVQDTGNGWTNMTNQTLAIARAASTANSANTTEVLLLGQPKLFNQT